MGVYTSLLGEVYNRLTKAQLETKKLENVKRVDIGARQLTFGIDEMPAIFLSISSIQEDYNLILSQNRISSVVDIKLTVIDGIEDPSVSNQYYDTDTREGILYLIEEILDVLNEDTSQSLDPRFGKNALKANTAFMGPIEKVSDNILMCDITITARTNQFTINNRRGG